MKLSTIFVGAVGLTILYTLQRNYQLQLHMAKTIADLNTSVQNLETTTQEVETYVTTLQAAAQPPAEPDLTDAVAAVDAANAKLQALVPAQAAPVPVAS